MWKPRLIDSAPTKYIGIVEALEADLRAGKLTAGARIPPQRSIALALGVDLTTVTRAMNEARRRNLIAAHTGRGTYVEATFAAPPTPGPRQIDLSLNAPPLPAQMDLRRLIPQGIASVLAASAGADALQYQDSAGAERHRLHGAQWLAPHLGPIEPERMVLACGAQSALHAICTSQFQRGAKIAVGAHTFPGFLNLIRGLGLQAIPVAMDQHGLCPQALRAICATQTLTGLYLIPTIDNPTTATLPLERRRELAQIIRDNGMILIEDDPYGALKSDTLPSLTQLAPAHSFHIATLSKCLTPAMRLAYVAAPNAQSAQQLAMALRDSALMCSPLLAALASHWIAEGMMDEICQAIRAENRARQALAAKHLKGLDYAADPEGHHLWLTLPQGWQASAFESSADRKGVLIVPGAAFAASPQHEQAVRISLGAASDRAALAEGLALLAQILSDQPRHARLVV